MSLVKDVYVHCDQCGDCEFASPTGRQARREAQQMGGWKRIEGKDYCSRCAAEQNVQSTGGESTARQVLSPADNNSPAKVMRQSTGG